MKFIKKKSPLILAGLLTLASFFLDSYYQRNLVQFALLATVYYAFIKEEYVGGGVILGLYSLLSFLGNYSIDRRVSFLHALTYLFLYITAVAEKIHTKSIRHQNQTLIYRNTTDHLTKVQNRKHFDFMIKDQYHKNISLLMIDIDHFKKINDHYGHPFGDKVLVEVARIIKDSLRAHDAAFRYGGEEFAVILLSPKDNDQLVAERIRKAVEKAVFYSGTTPVRVTISIGVARSFSTNNATHLVRVADRALYSAKESGRNQVAVVA